MTQENATPRGAKPAPRRSWLHRLVSVRRAVQVGVGILLYAAISTFGLTGALTLGRWRGSLPP